MLELPRQFIAGSDAAPPQDPEVVPGHALDVQRLLAAARRQGPVFAAMVAIALVLGVAYLIKLEPLYTADAFVLIDNRRIRAVENAYDLNSANADIASTLVDSQVELFRSAKISARVVRSLDLLNEPAYANIPSAPEGRFLKFRRHIMQFLGRSVVQTQNASRPDDEGARLRRAAEEVRNGMDIRRVARTMVLQISYTSPEPEQAARFANAYAEAYLADQLDAKFEATRLASRWLEERMSELKTKALSSDLAIQKFREEKGLISSGGKLVNEQQLSEINTQLVVARGETARAEARYRRIDAIIKGHQTNAIVSEAIGNAAIEQLRGKYLETSKRYAEILAKLGKEHQAAVSLREEMNEYEKLMFDELTRIAEGYRSEVEIASTREKSLTADLERIVGLNATENKTLVTLHELEREGETYRNLYQTYLQRYHEALQEQSFPIIEARIITSAAAPDSPSHPKKIAIFILFGLLGGAAGAAIGFYRELREKGFQSEDQIQSQLGLECLGILPKITGRTLVSDNYAEKEQAEEADEEAHTIARVNPKYTVASFGILSYALLRPASSFAETLLAVKLAADVKIAGNRCKIIGTVSVMPGEGKSTFSKNLASLLAQLGKKTLLIDADMRVARLTRQLAPSASKGLLEAVVYGEPLDSLLMVEQRSGLYMLPCVIPPKMSHTSDFLASNRMKEFLAEAQKFFDYIVVDLPPLGPVLDARAIEPQLDGFVLVVEWRKTGRKIVRNILANSTEIYNKSLGVVMNKVNVNELRLYAEPGSHYRHYAEYADSYYFEGTKDTKPLGNFMLLANFMRRWIIAHLKKWTK
ncbi:MAG: polysaccharide biosynthesis tyrosine autokinase [Rhodomicrobium sp.]